MHATLRAKISFDHVSWGTCSLWDVRSSCACPDFKSQTSDVSLGPDQIGFTPRASYPLPTLAAGLNEDRRSVFSAFDTLAYGASQERGFG